MRYAPTIALALTVACGPTPAANVDGTGASSSDSTTGEAPSSTGSQPPPPPVTTTGSTGSVASAGDESTTDDDDGGIDFIEMPDSPGCPRVRGQHVAAVSFECSPWKQDCCPTEQCVPWANDGSQNMNATRCSPVAKDPAAIGEPCVAQGSGVSGFDNCDVGAICWEVDPDTLEGTCIAQCTGEPDAPECPPDLVCTIAGDESVTVCLPPCNPLASECPFGTSCFNYGNQFVCTSLPESAAEGEPCKWINACDPGLTCVDADLADCKEPPCCTPFCDLIEGDQACPDAAMGQVCTPWSEVGTPPEGFDNLGVCLP